MKEPFLGIQLGAHSVFDEGVEMRDRATHNLPYVWAKQIRNIIKARVSNRLF